MARNGFIIVTLMFLIFGYPLSNASIVLNFRKVIRLNRFPSATQNSPLLSPVIGGKDLNSSTIDAGKPVKEKPKDPEVINNKITGAASQPNREQRDKVDGTKDSQLVSNGSCGGLPKSCEIQNTMIACILTSEEGSKQLVILVQNQAERTLKVNIANPTAVDNASLAFEIPSYRTKKVFKCAVRGTYVKDHIPIIASVSVSEHQTTASASSSFMFDIHILLFLFQINILVAEVKTNKIALNTENGDCVIHAAPALGKNFFKQLSFYSKQVTPIYGVYFLFLVALVFGGIWACCKLRKRRWQGGVPYQELEMGLPESAAAAVANVDSTEGWDQDWDEDKAVKFPGGHHAGSISTNGLTFRSYKKDGWEVD